MIKMTIIEGNSNDKDNVRVIMVKGEKGDTGDPTKLSQLENDTDFVPRDEIDEQIDAVNLNLSSQIRSLASGSPLVASSTSGMTDTTKIYVNTTDGKWYYYNGSSWVAGGVYQSTGISNDDLAIDGRNTKTSKLAMYDGYEELKSIGEVYTFEHGDLGGSVGNEITFTDQQWRMRTSENYPIVLGIGEDIEILNMSDGYVSTRLFVCDNNNNLLNISSWQQANIYLHGETNKKYYLAIQITGHYNWEVTTEELAKIRIRQTKINRQNYLHSLFDVNVYPFALNQSITFDSSNRCLTDFINYDGKIKIKGIYQYMVHKFNKTTKEYIGDETGWSNTGYFTFSPNYLYKIQFRKSDNSDLTVNEVLNNIKIYPIEQADASIIYNSPNIILNNHQGYSSEYPTGMNLASSYYNSFLQGYKNVECDIRFTSDNIPVCSHDPSFVSNGVTVVISEHTYQELLTYNYYDGNTISSLDDVMKNCKRYGLNLQLDQLSSEWTDTQWTNLFNVIDKYQMKDYVIYSAGNQTLINKVLAFDSKATCLLNISNLDNLSASLTLAHNNKNGKNKFIIAINYQLITPQELATLNLQLEEDIYAGVWTIDDLTTLLQYIPYAYMITTNKITNDMIINDYIG